MDHILSIILFTPLAGRRDFGHLDVTLTVTDPKTFTKPVTVSFVEELLPDTDVFEHYCLENEKHAGHEAKPAR